MFDSCVSALVQGINVQRQGNASKLRVGNPFFMFVSGAEFHPPQTAFFLGGLSLGSRFCEKLTSRLRFMHIRVFKPEHLL